LDKGIFGDDTIVTGGKVSEDAGEDFKFLVGKFSFEVGEFGIFEGFRILSSHGVKGLKKKVEKSKEFIIIKFIRVWEILNIRIDC